MPCSALVRANAPITLSTHARSNVVEIRCWVQPDADSLSCPAEYSEEPEQSQTALVLIPMHKPCERRQGADIVSEIHRRRQATTVSAAVDC